MRHSLQLTRALLVVVLAGCSDSTTAPADLFGQLFLSAGDQSKTLVASATTDYYLRGKLVAFGRRN